MNDQDFEIYFYLHKNGNAVRVQKDKKFDLMLKKEGFNLVCRMLKSEWYELSKGNKKPSQIIQDYIKEDPSNMYLDALIN
jgi:hypothetical protein